MKNLLFIHLLFILLMFGAAPHSFAATTAEASVGHEKVTIGIYDVSHMTTKEQEWFVTFLKGNFFADGWEQISSDILMSTQIHERELQRIRLDELGYKIGYEWSKENDIRKIHTSRLKKWGRELKDTAEEAPHLLTEVIQRIDSEVNELLN